MHKGDVVTVVTGCKDCGDVQALVHDLCHDNVYIEIIGELPHSLKDKPDSRWMWIDRTKLK
ncbi:hypothetical protein UFOVP685_40 [uncultured Caudovirales phage]|uniref:Uncharacterized protein n=1 Tax=uncultured Caudovirales phage TaxID=2100421 RepID=A0A6J7X6Z4_9CAUD|nr:hypothetical protein UFOVP590_44 [uncultured Caudovirales phage]CAB4157670.1 hypothetical protein UFOVP685_40 [uncultured Caudovirales phage]CAB5225320.1 hypothetical protein UFOVP750_12 [uncultured Caudovirales phage]